MSADLDASSWRAQRGNPPVHGLPRCARNDQGELPSRIRLKLNRADFVLDVDLELPGQGITVLFGVSGSGKTSLLRCVAGLERTPGALVSIAGETWQDDAASVYLPTWQRPLGYVFQEASLFEHLNVRGNLQFGLKRIKGAADASALGAAIDLLGISALLERKTTQLSGGERQRVAIARALAAKPKLIVCDEITSALDVSVQASVIETLKQLQETTQVGLLFVTHNLALTRTIADRVAVMRKGTIVEYGGIDSVFNNPKAEYTGRLLEHTPSLK